MKQLAQTSQSTTAQPTKVFALWADTQNWPAFDHGIEWTKFTAPFAIGNQYQLKPKGGPALRATIVEIAQDQLFVDVSHLIGTELRVTHHLETQGALTHVSVRMELSGPLSWLWAKILGKNQQTDLEKSTAQLIAIAEGRA